MLEHQPLAEQTVRNGPGALGHLIGQRLIEQTRANPELFPRIQAGNPQLSEAIRSNDSERAMALLIEAEELSR